MIEIIADVRCLQDAGYRTRGVGHLTRTLLRRAAEFAPDSIVLVGIVDPRMEPLSPADNALFARTMSVDTAAVPARGAIFVQPSPMTHPQHPLLRVTRARRLLRATVVYDFIPFDVPAHYLPTTLDRIAYHTALFALSGGDLFFPISRYTAGRLMAISGVPESRVFTIGAPIRDELITASRETAPGDAIPHGGVPYFLVVAGDDWRKNVECAIAGYGALMETPEPAPMLVIVGPYSPQRQAALTAMVPEPRRARILFRNGLTDGEVASLYCGALATICPSRIEGFSLPVVEALSCGSPVFAADCAAQVELVPDPEALFGPDDSARLAILMTKLLNDPGFRPALLERQRGVALAFAERAVAERFWTPIYREYRGGALAGPSIRRNARPRLAFVTPYPPDTSGVADYTARSLVDLREHAEIDLYTDAREPRLQAGVKLAGPISSFPYLSRSYDAVVSVVGNSDFHTRIIEYVRDFGGACIEHDNRLADFYRYVRGFETFARMARGPMGRRVTRSRAEAGLLRPEVFKTLFFDEIVRSAQPFIVHSRGIQRNVRKQYGVEAQYLPFCPYREFPDAELSETSRAAARARLGIGRDTIAIATFGGPHFSKCDVECIEAVALLRARRIDAEISFVGTPTPHIDHLRRVVRKLRLEPFVHFMDQHVPEGTYRDHLIASDIAIQLRTHGLGGLSGALLDAIACGLPAVANVDLADAMESPSYVSRVPDEITARAVAEAVAELVSTGRHRLRVSAERIAYTERHSFRRYARELMAVLGLEANSREGSKLARGDGGVSIWRVFSWLLTELPNAGIYGW